MNDSARRRVIGVLVPLIPLAALIGAFAIWWDRLPDPIASHWGFDGKPNDSIDLGVFAGLMIAIVAVAGVGAHVASLRRNPEPPQLSAAVALATLLQWTFALVGIFALVANLDAAGWEQADDVPILLAIVPLLLAASVAAGVARIARPIEHRSPVADEVLPSVGLAPGERVAWTGTMHVSWPLYFGGAIWIGGLMLLTTVGLGPGLLMVVSGSLVLAFASVKVVVDRRGLAVGYGPFGWPRTRIALDRIERAAVIDVAPGSHGGWGYRGSLRLLGRAAVILRSGEAIRLDLRGGKRFIVTVDDATTAAGTLNDLAEAGAQS